MATTVWHQRIKAGFCGRCGVNAPRADRSTCERCEAEAVRCRRERRKGTVGKHFTPEQRAANGRKGGLRSGRIRSVQSERQFLRLATRVWMDTRTDMPQSEIANMLPLLVAMYRTGYRNGYAASYTGRRRKRLAEAA
jgi:hypothetical protein